MHQNRVNKVLQLMAEQNLTQMLVSDPCAIFYLTGTWIHPGERLLALYLTQSGKHKLFVNELFPIADAVQCDKVWLNDNMDGIGVLADYIKKDKPVAVDKNWPSRFLIGLMDRHAGSAFVNGSEIIDRVRMVKDAEELEIMREASKLCDIGCQKMIDLVKEDYDEETMGKKLGEIWEGLGASGHSFDPIVAYGPNGADPHHTTERGVHKKPGDSVVIDIGCVYNSYCSDMTRTVFYKSASAEQKKVYEIVRDANLKAIDKVKPGVTFAELDAAARDYITEKGYGKYFTHRLGHSIGLEDHEVGDVSAVNTDVVVPGRVFSIEPGVYLPGNFGVRVEDLVIATEDGCEVLNHVSKDLTIVE